MRECRALIARAERSIKADVGYGRERAVIFRAEIYARRDQMFTSADVRLQIYVRLRESGKSYTNTNIATSFIRTATTTRVGTVRCFEALSDSFNRRIN